jgi:hypothetical protein
MNATDVVQSVRAEDWIQQSCFHFGKLLKVHMGTHYRRALPIKELFFLLTIAKFWSFASHITLHMAAVAAPVAVALGSTPVGWAVAGAVLLGVGLALAANKKHDGRSPFPPAKRNRYNTKKEAKEAGSTGR